MKQFWIIGYPLSYCLTTPVMNGCFDALGIDAEFETKEVPPEGLNDVIEQLKSQHIAGAVTTMPHKTPSISLLDEMDEEVKIINACNLILSTDNKLRGYNTDWIGAVEAIKHKKPEIEGTHIHILGAGGAARAAAYGLNKAGAKVSIWNRTPERAKNFAEKIGIEWVEDMREWDGRPEIIINATSLSYQPKQSTLVPYPLWENVDLAMDAVYGKTSLFLEEAKAANVPHVLSGENWFAEQFIPMFKLITGKDAPLDLVLKLTEESQKIRY